MGSPPSLEVWNVPQNPRSQKLVTFFQHLLISNSFLREKTFAKANVGGTKMKTNKVSETTIKESPHGVDVRMLYDEETAQAVHMKLKPGESLKPHITPVDVFFFVIEGSPEILVGNEKQVVEENTLVESPKDIVHCIYNNSSKDVRVLVVKAPRPTTQTKVL